MKPTFFNINFSLDDAICKDGTKPCFVISRYFILNEFVKKLETIIDSNVIVKDHLGYKVLYVQCHKYKIAVIEGLKIIIENVDPSWNGITWINYYKERTYWGNVQILAFSLNKNKFSSNGFLKASSKIYIKRYAKKLSKILNLTVTYDENFGRVRFFVPRNINSHLEHDIILEKIRKSNILNNSFFAEYALLSYFGKYIK